MVPYPLLSPSPSNLCGEGEEFEEGLAPLLDALQGEPFWVNPASWFLPQPQPLLDQRQRLLGGGADAVGAFFQQTLEVSGVGG